MYILCYSLTLFYQLYILNNFGRILMLASILSCILCISLARIHDAIAEQNLTIVKNIAFVVMKHFQNTLLGPALLQSLGM